VIRNWLAGHSRELHPKHNFSVFAKEYFSARFGPNILKFSNTFKGCPYSMKEYINISIHYLSDLKHGLRTPREEIAFTARPKIQSESQIFRYGRSIFCLPHHPNFSDIFDLCLHWVSVVRDQKDEMFAKIL
jgi:hypothetical protein